MDLFKGGAPKKVSICDTTDERGAAKALGGRFLREDCGFFETCSHRVEDYDFTLSPAGSAVEIWYCQIDWTRVGPLMVVILIALGYAYKKYKDYQATGMFANVGVRRPHFNRSRFRR